MNLISAHPVLIERAAVLRNFITIVRSDNKVSLQKLQPCPPPVTGATDTSPRESGGAEPPITRRIKEHQGLPETGDRWPDIIRGQSPGRWWQE
jgi:hypothetical protein